MFKIVGDWNTQMKMLFDSFTHEINKCIDVCLVALMRQEVNSWAESGVGIASGCPDQGTLVLLKGHDVGYL